MQPHESLLAEEPQLQDLPRITRPLLAWYAENARDLPWRRNPSPYRIWVSEVMLQQTRVEAVKGYFTRFIESLPDVGSLAAVPEERLLKLWEGLGYYNRARNMRRAARILTERYSGALPASYAQLLELPGFGEYTAGAVASIAFGVPVPAVDGNVYRVLSRLLASYADTSLPAVKRAYRQAAASLLGGENPGDVNQALMELGAVLCLPNAAPVCGGCPVAGYCAARQAGCAGDLPVKAAKRARRTEERTIVLIVSEGRVLLHRRPGKGLLAGMLEPANLEGTLEPGQVLQSAADLGANGSSVHFLGNARHIFSHVEWRMGGYLLRSRPFPPPDGWLWADAAALRREHALPSAFRAFTGVLPQYGFL